MKRFIALSVLSICALSVTAFAADTEKFMSDIAAKSGNSVAALSYTVNVPGTDGKIEAHTITGQAICIDASGVFITTFFDPTMDPAVLKKDGKEDITLTLPGADGKTVKATFIGTDLVSSLGFIQADATDVASKKVTFTPVEFTDAPLKVGQPVASVGIMAGDGNRTLYLGVGYVSAVLHVPGPLAYVTGGKLTNLCSPVFGADGKAVGLVARQLPLMSRTETNQGLMPAPARGEDETAFFTPTEDFAQVVQKKENWPKDDKIRRMMWIGINQFSPVSDTTAEDLHAKNIEVKLPAMMIDQIIPDEPAAKAGLKEGDIITGINGQKLEKLANPAYAKQSFMRQLLKLQANAKVDLTVLTPTDAGAKERNVSVAFKAMPTTINEAPRIVDQAQGMQLREQVPLDKYLSTGAVADKDGLVVEGVGQNSLASKAGLQANDVITKVDNANVTKVADYKKAVEAKKGQSIKITVYRGTDKQAVTPLITLDIPQ